MMRSTMRWWIQKCPNCSYVSGDIENATSARVKWLKAIELVLSDKMKFKSSLAEDFYKHYLISHRDMRVKDAFYAILHAAWACDDCLDGENAVFCRKLAIEELDRFVENDRKANLKPEPKKKSVLLPGSRLLRTWHGKTYEVTVRKDGKFTYEGRIFRTLSGIATEITGSHWNGKVFFGVK
jgi:hypothetical protein